MTTLFRAAIGPINPDYYLPRFTRFEAADRAGLSWNWAAGVYTLNWLLFRGLRAAALIYAALMLTATLILLGLAQLLAGAQAPLGTLMGTHLGADQQASAGLAAVLNSGWAWGLALTGLGLSVVLPGMLGNALLFAHCRKAMTAALEANSTLKAACDQLQAQAASRQRFVRLLVGNALLLGLAAVLSGWLAWRNPTVPQADPAPATPVRPIQMTPVASAPTALAASDPVASAPEPAASAGTNADVAVNTNAAKASDTMSPAVANPVAVSVPLAAPTPALASAPISVAASAPKPLPAPVPTPASAPAAKPLQRIDINAGLFANPANADTAFARLQAAGLPVRQQLLSTPQGPRTRLRVGPFATPAEAAAALKQIRALGLDAALVKP